MENDTGNSKWWPVLYVGRNTSKDEQGSYIWKLREELSAALENVDLSGMLLYATTDEAIQTDNSYQMSGNKISVKTLDLNRDFSEIAAQLNDIVAVHFS